MDRALVTLEFDDSQLTLPALSFCLPTPAKIKVWANELPVAKRGEAARQLYHAIDDLNHLICSASVRYSLIEAILPVTLQTLDTLTSNYLTKSVALTPQQRKVADITQAININLASVYRLVVKQYIHEKKNSDKKFLTEAIYRALQCASYSLLRSQQLYIAPPGRFWLDFNDLFSLAERLNLTDKQLKLEDNFILHLNTIRAVYATTLLFYTCKPAQLRQAEQLAVYKALPNWSHFVSIHHPATSEDLFVVRLDKNMPPLYQSFFHEVKDQESAGLDISPLIKGFNASKLVENLKHKTAGAPLKQKSSSGAALEIPPDIDHALMTHLLSTWGVMAIRTAERKPVKGNLDICLGLAAAHHYVSVKPHINEQTLSTDISDVTSSSNDSPTEQDEMDDAFYAQAMASLTYGQIATGQANANENYPTFSVSVVNISNTGCCLQFSNPPAHLRSGELVGIRQESGWRMGAIRRLQYVKNKGLQMGIEFLGSHALPCSTKLLHETGETSTYMRTFIISTNNLKTLITPRVPFKEGSKAYLKIGDTERRINLSLLVAATGGFCQFKFNYITELEKQPEE